MQRLYIVFWYDGDKPRTTLLYGEHDLALQWIREHTDENNAVNGVVSCPPTFGRDYIYVGLESEGFQEFEGIKVDGTDHYDVVVLDKLYDTSKQKQQQGEISATCPEHHDCDVVYK